MSLHSIFARVFAQPKSWLRAVGRRDRLEASIEAELLHHLENLTEDLIRDGYAPEEAARRARIALGALTVHKEGMRASLGLQGWDQLWADLRYAARTLRKSPGFTAIAAVSLALAIGANTTIFSAAKQVLYERLAVPDARNLRLLTWVGPEDHVAVHHVHGDQDPMPGGMETSPVFPYPVYEQIRARNGVLGDLLAFRETGMNATIRNQAQQVLAEMVSGNYYGVLGVKPQLGRGIEPADDQRAGQPVVVISDELWDRAFGRSPAVLGEWMKLNDKPVRIVGVNPPEFTGAKSVLETETPSVIVPLAEQPILTPAADGRSWLVSPVQWWVNILGRAKPGVSDRTAQAALDTQLTSIGRALLPVRAGEMIPSLVLRDGSRGLFEQRALFAEPLTVLMALVGLVLLLACANIANLMLARGAQRQREMSVRLALGAGRARILRQMLVESLLLASIGGAGGLVLGYFGRTILPQLTENGWQRHALGLHFDWVVAAFAAAITILTGIIFGVAPALAAAHAEVSDGLKEGAQTTTRRRKGMGGKALVGFQIALSTVLVIGSGLFLQTFARLSAVDAGFRTDHLLLFEVNLPRDRYPAGKDIALHQRLEREFSALPGVESVSPAEDAFLSGDSSGTDFLPAGELFDGNKRQEENYAAVGTRFFETMRIPILAGRAFGPQDTASSPKVGVINQSLAKKRFPGQDAVGKMFRTDTHDADGHVGSTTTDWIQIIGICGDTRYANLRDPAPPLFFLPYVQQQASGGMAYQIRTRMRPEAVLDQLRGVIERVDPDLPLVNIRTEQQQVDADLIQERVFMTLTSGFGLLALALSCVGIYGVMAYSVANRRNEIGIRMALGARPGEVRGMILGESGWLASAGVLLGAGAALGLTRLVKAMLYGIEPYDPPTIVGGVLILLLVALAASWIPAGRAARVQPMDALRHE
jgi:predicted permease